MPIRGSFDRHNERGVATATTSGALPRALTADIGVVDLDPRPARAKLIAAVPLDHRLHQFVLNPARQHWSRSPVAGPARCWTAPFCPGRADAWRGTTPASAAWCPGGRCRRSAMSDGGTAGIAAVDAHGSHNTLTPHTADT